MVILTSSKQFLINFWFISTFSHSFLHGIMARNSLDVLDMGKQWENFIPWGLTLLVCLRLCTCLGRLRLYFTLSIRTIQISNVFYIIKCLIPYIHLRTWWKTCFYRETIGLFGISLHMERFEKFKAGCKRILLSFGESLFKVWTIHIIGIIMSLLSTYQNNLHN